MNPYTAPVADLELPAAPTSLTFAAHDPLPLVCLGCGAKKKKHVKRRPLEFRSIPRWVYPTLAVGVLPFAVIVALTQKTAKAALPLCEPCFKAWLDRSMFRSGLIVASAVAVVVVATVGFGGAPLVGLGMAAIAGVGIAFGRVQLLPPSGLRLGKVERDGVVTLEGVNAAAAAKFAEMRDEEDE